MIEAEKTDLLSEATDLSTVAPKQRPLVKDILASKKQAARFEAEATKESQIQTMMKDGKPWREIYITLNLSRFDNLVEKYEPKEVDSAPVEAARI